MATVKRIVDFLRRENALQLDSSPWKIANDDLEIAPIDWSRLFPPNSPRPDGNEWDIFDDAWEPELDDDFLRRVAGALRDARPRPKAESDAESGGNWDACAWYQPIHFFAYDWGIFIREDCVTTLALKIVRFLEPQSIPSQSIYRLGKALIRAATFAYFLHERFHHKVECLGLRLHVVSGVSRYLSYYSKVYKKHAGTDDLLEEAIANAEMFRCLGDEPYKSWISAPVVRAARDYLQWSFPANPPGYRKAVEYLQATQFSQGENRLQGQVKECSLTPSQPAGDWDVAPRLLQSFFSVNSSIMKVVRPNAKPVLPSRTLPVKTCSTESFQGFLESIGYRQDPKAKKELKLKKRGWPTVVLPRNRENVAPLIVSRVIQAIGTATGRKLELSHLNELLEGAIDVTQARREAM